jgi:ribulose-5-phosphate 4-epimerase/fuculose-1-phosphate aldolase
MNKLEVLNDLAAVFRWTARLNMHEGIANHFSVCVPDSNEDFYINGSGMHFSTIKASDLVLVEQNKIEEIKQLSEQILSETK